jgi:hypothetical protein
MIDHLLSPDGQQVWSDVEDLPPHLKSKWVDLEIWNEYMACIRECPICSSLMDIDFEDGSAECHGCDQYFHVVDKDPLTLEHLIDPIMKFYLPLEFEHPLITTRGMEFHVQCNPDTDGPGIEEMIVAINDSLNEVRDSMLATVQQAIDDLDDWFEVYANIDVIEQEKPRYVIDDED